MGGEEWHDRVIRNARFETFEPRQLMTADPIAEPIADFQLDYEINEQVDLSISPLASTYGYTGLATARTAFGLTGVGQTVAVIDSGIAFDHPALGGGFGGSARIVGGWDFTEENDNNPYDDGPGGSHGSHVAGIIGSTDTTSPGVAPGVDLVALRVFNDQGTGVFSWVENALQWVHDNRNSFRNPITTVNLSLGTTWNSSSLPEWSILENEFAQLKADGIFIAVAAGNAFATYNAPGLSYPAVSSYVVPVSSVDESGNLSSFSQRHERAIAAPGRSIRSTVPDYAGNLNRKPDDFANYSGTSMASPYVAGASVLVRQALQMAGHTGINQDAIYDIMRSTADTIYDAATNSNYLRLNVGRAIESIFPADDYGSTAATAYGLPAGNASVSGMISRYDDRDYFSFTATTGGTATVVVTGNIAAQFELVGGGGTVSGNQLTFNVVAGQSYTFGVSSATLGSYSLSESVRPNEMELGSLAYRTVSWASASGFWGNLTASHDATLTVQAEGWTGTSNVDLEIYNSNWQLVAQSTSGALKERIDIAAHQGEVFHIHVMGNYSQGVTVTAANLVSRSGQTVTLAGAGLNEFRIEAGAETKIFVNQLAYSFTADTLRTVQFTEGLPASVAVVGSAGNDVAVLSPGSLTMSGSGYQFTVVGPRSFTVSASGGYDQALIYDSAGTNAIGMSPSTAEIVGTDFRNVATGFDVVRAFSSGGGDRAYFYDSAGNDVFGATPTYAELAGSGFNLSANNFRFVEVHATTGYDLAYLYDSAGDDGFGATPTYAELSGSNFFLSTFDFDRVRTQASTGNDRAYFYDSAGNDGFGATSTYAEMLSGSYHNSAANFDTVSAQASTGQDVAYFYGSAGDDGFGATPTYAEMRGAGYFNAARNFDRVSATGGGGNDTACLYDSAGNDGFGATPTYAELSGANYFLAVNNFRHVRAFASTGYDRAYFYDSAGNDVFLVSSIDAQMLGASFDNSAARFDFVHAQASGGEDSAYFTGSAGDDRYGASSRYAEMLGAGYQNIAENFDRVSATGGAGNDIAFLYDSIGDDLLNAAGATVTLTGADYSNLAIGFEQVRASATAGRDTKHVLAVDFLLNEVGDWE